MSISDKIEKAPDLPIGEKEIAEAAQILQEYKRGKARLEAKIVQNEQWWKLRHWEVMKSESEEDQRIEPASAWLFNTIASRHADAMDNYPEPNVLPREQSDEPAAKALSAILPVVMEQNEFEDTYSNAWWYKLKHGASVYGAFWDNTKLNGLGDITIREIDLLNLFWEPGITDIQRSRNVFHCELVDNNLLEEQYPQLKDTLGGSSTEVAQYLYDDQVSTANKSTVVDWYYKRGGLLHYCKFVNNTVLFADENEPKQYHAGFYRHGRYPFVLDVLYPVEGTIGGMGFIDIERDPQMYVDLLDQAILSNAMSNAAPRYFVRGDEQTINEAEFLDLAKPFVHTNGNLGEDAVRPIEGKSLNGIYVTVRNNKIQELKETSGNTDASQGITTSVTTASGIASLQEAAGKLVRDMIKTSYRTYARLCYLCIELMRQFYDEQRSFRIIGDNGDISYQQFSNAMIAPQAQGTDFGTDMGERLPVFDIRVSAQKTSPYTKASQNETALNFYKLGFFNPQMADQAIACLQMMDFDRKDQVLKAVQQNGGMFRQMMMMQQQIVELTRIIDAMRGTDHAETAEESARQTIANNTVTPAGDVKTGSQKDAYREKAAGKTAAAFSPT
ncbi:MAG: hypothetical protein IJ043_03115 [Clostridia bacterium]|nr:hypothetical protein [Clostridia bacterium]